MSRRSNIGRTVFGVAAAAGVAGLLNYTPPPTELRAAAPSPPVRSRPVVSGPFTATPASVPLPVRAAPATTAAPTPPPPPATTAVPPVTEPPEPPPPPEPPAGVEAESAPSSAPVYYPPEPVAEAADDSGDKCAHFDNLLSALDDSELRAAVATVGCV